jgi:hypothetical protein
MGTRTCWAIPVGLVRPNHLLSQGEDGLAHDKTQEIYGNFTAGLEHFPEETRHHSIGGHSKFVAFVSPGFIDISAGSGLRPDHLGLLLLGEMFWLNQPFDRETVKNMPFTILYYILLCIYIYT